MLRLLLTLRTLEVLIIVLALLDLARLQLLMCRQFTSWTRHLLRLLLLHIIGHSECIADQDRHGDVLLDWHMYALDAPIPCINQHCDDLVLPGVLLLLIGDKSRLQRSKNCRLSRIHSKCLTLLNWLLGHHSILVLR